MEEEINENIESIRKKIEKLEEDGGPYETENLKKILNSLSKIAKSVHSNGLFSTNEDFNEVKPEDIKFLLIPFYQADIIQKFIDNRESKLALALKFYDEFFKILENYNYFSKEKKDLYNFLRKKQEIEIEEKETKNISLELLSLQREDKIRSYKYKKALSDKIKVK